MDFQILCALKDLCNKWLAGLNVTVVNPASDPVNVDLTALLDAVTVLNDNITNNTTIIQTTLESIPQLEGLGLTPWCDAVTGDVVAWSSVIIPDENAPTVTQTLFFDAALNPIVAPPVGSAPCVGKEETLYPVEGCDDVTGETVVKFITSAGVVINTITQTDVGFGDCVCPNRAPIAIPLSNLTNPEGSVISLSFASAFTDPDGDTLTFTATGLPPSLLIDSAGLVTGIIDLAAAGTYNVVITADDGNGGVTTNPFVWTVTV